MNLPFKFGTKPSKDSFSFGLDIGTAMVKAVKLKFSKDNTELIDYRLEPGALDLAPVLKKITEALEIKKVNLSISGVTSVIRYVSFPKMNKDELKQALKFEAQKHIPFSVSDVELDAYILKDNLPDNKMLVLLAAAKKEFIRQRLKLFENLNIRVNLIDIDSLALINAFNYNYSPEELQSENKSVALLNIGASTTNLNILENSFPCLSRDIHFAGDNFTQKIVDIMGIEFKAAEQLKLKPVPESENKVMAALEAALSHLAGEIRTSFDYYETQSASSVGKIFLSGAGSTVYNLKERLANVLGIGVEFWEPLKKINIASNLEAEKLKLLAPQLGVAVGLALRRAND